MTPENEMKMSHVWPEPDRFDFAVPDAMVEFAGRARKAFHGHALVFGQQLPSWLVKKPRWAPGEARELMRGYIKAVVGRYKGRVASWDVVNEPLDPAGGMATNFYQRYVGVDYVDVAFRAAHEADPNAKLYLNEIGAETLGPKSDGLYELVKRLRRDGVPIHGVGLQGHSLIGPGAPDRGALAQNLERFAKLGVELAISEVDVRTSTGTGSVAERFAAQADVYREMAAACIEQPACQRFTTWGITDRVSWLGRDERALPFGEDLRAKPAWTALTAALR